MMSTAVDIPVPAYVPGEKVRAYRQNSEEMKRLERVAAEPTLPLNPQAVALAEQQRASTGEIQLDFPQTLASDVELVMALPLDEDEDDFHKRPTEYVESVKLPVAEALSTSEVRAVRATADNLDVSDTPAGFVALPLDADGRPCLVEVNRSPHLLYAVEQLVKRFHAVQGTHPILIEMGCTDYLQCLSDPYYRNGDVVIPIEYVFNPDFYLCVKGPASWLL